ncbi:MAG TPA: hypothetical protein VGR57_21275, partial [Ktedonobacterales bacterium]|nr:hypothetical protein [Ktedonobacterales bacterium]
AMDEAATLAALLSDLTALRDYLSERGRHTYELAQRFLQNARRETPERAYDERQATMLEYQNYIWHEIAGRVDQLLARYAPGQRAAPDAGAGSEARAEGADGA